MTNSAKLLVLGPPDGDQGRIVSAISEVKIQSSARNPTGAGYVPMDFGRVKVGADMDLQLFGFERDQVEVVVDAVAPGVVGALAVVNAQDVLDPTEALSALDALASSSVITVVVGPTDFEASLLADKLNVPVSHVFQYSQVDRKVVKGMILKVLDAALQTHPRSSTG